MNSDTNTKNTLDWQTYMPTNVFNDMLSGIIIYVGLVSLFLIFAFAIFKLVSLGRLMVDRFWKKRDKPAVTNDKRRLKTALDQSNKEMESLFYSDDESEHDPHQTRAPCRGSSPDESNETYELLKMFYKRNFTKIKRHLFVSIKLIPQWYPITKKKKKKSEKKRKKKNTLKKQKKIIVEKI